eukprot:812399-Pleurochrysis_carterae.AAC.1
MLACVHACVGVGACVRGRGRVRAWAWARACVRVGSARTEVGDEIALAHQSRAAGVSFGKRHPLARHSRAEAQRSE